MMCGGKQVLEALMSGRYESCEAWDGKEFGDGGPGVAGIGVCEGRGEIILSLRGILKSSEGWR